MITLWIDLVGNIAVALAVLAGGRKLKKACDLESAQNAVRMVHLFFYLGQVFPGLLIMIYPGLKGIDRLLGLPPLPAHWAIGALGVFLCLSGCYFLASSNRALVRLGRGTLAFKLTKQIVQTDIYQRVRNPMSLGYYLLLIGVSLLARSTAATLGSLLVVIPVHVFFLLCFEEKELAIRYGQSYAAYKAKVPFIIPRLKSGVM